METNLKITLVVAGLVAVAVAGGVPDPVVSSPAPVDDIVSFSATARRSNPQPTADFESPEAQSTPKDEIDRGLLILNLQPGERLIDPGCGEGEVLVQAALGGHAAVGIEIDPQRAEVARDLAEQNGVAHHVQITTGDAAEVDWQGEVGYVYLFPDTLIQLRPKLVQLDRFVSYMHPVPGLPMMKIGDFYFWTHDQGVPGDVVFAEEDDDDDNLVNRAILYTDPSYCIPCQQQAPIVSKLKNAGWRIDIRSPSHPDYAAAGVNGIPGWVFVDSDGDWFTTSGLLSEDEIIAFLTTDIDDDDEVSAVGSNPRPVHGPWDNWGRYCTAPRGMCTMCDRIEDRERAIYDAWVAAGGNETAAPQSSAPTLQNRSTVPRRGRWERHSFLGWEWSSWDDDDDDD